MITIENVEETKKGLPQFALVEFHPGSETPAKRNILKTWLESQEMNLTPEPEYLIIREDGSKEIVKWFNGWNCFLRYDKTGAEWYVSRKRELTDVVAWAELPDYIPGEGASDV